MNSVYEICFIGGLILAIIFLITTIILFIVLGIPKVISDLSGRSAKKAIKERKQGKTSDSSVAKKEQAKYYNQSSGKITARDTVSQETRAKNQDNTTDNLGKKNIKEALQVLNNLIYAKEPIQKILITLYNHFKKVYLCMIAIKHNKDIVNTSYIRFILLFTKALPKRKRTF